MPPEVKGKVFEAKHPPIIVSWELRFVVVGPRRTRHHPKAGTARQCQSAP